MKSNSLPLTALVLLLSVCGNAAAGDASVLDDEHKEYHFVATWRTSGGIPENVMEAGVIYRCGNTICSDLEVFPGRLNLQRIKLPYRHEMKEETHATNCTDEFMTTIHGARSKSVPTRVQSAGQRLDVRAGGGIYEWEKSDKGNYYELKSMRLDGAAASFGQVIGYLYESEGLLSQGFDRKTFDAYFDGEISHKDTLASANSDWSYSRTSIDFRKFRQSQVSPVISLTVAGAPEVLKRMRKPVQVQQSVLPPLPESERLRYFNHEYGHDFNADGCFDEFGHNKLMLPVLGNGQVMALLFIEYTPDNQDKVPMLSIGRYFRK